MILAELIYRRLTTFTETASRLATRCYPVQAPQDAPLPHAVFTVAARQPVGGTPRISTVRLQVDAFAPSYAQAWAVGRACSLALEGWADTSDAVTQVLNARPQTLSESWDEETRTYRVALDANLIVVD